jgi:hypothetical protein
MKLRLFITALGFVAFFAINAITILIPFEAKASEPIICKVEIFDCPGWGTGNRQVCHQNGNGVSCTCGESTTCPEIKE